MFLITCFIFGLLGSVTWAGPRGRTVCPPGTFAHISRNQWYCFKFYGDRLTFEEAEVQCQFKWKGHLASFNSENQAKSVGAYVAQKNLRSDNVWIGFRQDEGLKGKTEWRWVDGSESIYKKLSNNQPNNNSNIELCAGLSPQSGHVTWNELDCSHELPFLCKWKPA